MAIDVSVIIVSWNVAELLRQCLQSVLDAPDARGDRESELHLGCYTAEVYVVDNASSDGSPELVRRLFPQVRLIVSDTNLGFTAGNNIALRACRGRYVLLLNPDARLVGAALETMLDYMESHPEIGVVGPRLLYPDGTPQSSRRRFPTLVTALLESTLLQQWFPHNRWARMYYVLDHPDDAIQDVDWLTGACLLVRRQAIECVGLLDERFFMYSEELDWCRRIVAAGWRVVYLPQAQVVHHEGQSSGQVTAARQIRFESSKVLYFRKHHGQLQAELLRAFLLGTHLFKLTEETIKYLIGHMRPLRRQRIRAHLKVLRSGLFLPDPGQGAPR